MTGRWMMAAIQMTFAVMPALVYWFAGWSQATITNAATAAVVQSDDVEIRILNLLHLCCTVHDAAGRWYRCGSVFRVGRWRSSHRTADYGGQPV
jgi:ATP-binding cassette subfamily B protein